MFVIRCPCCGNCLGTIVAGHLVSRHRGRKIIAGQPCAIVCEKCGAVWTNRWLVAKVEDYGAAEVPNGIDS